MDSRKMISCDACAFQPGFEVCDQAGRRYIVVGVYERGLYIEKSTWWRRLYWRWRRRLRRILLWRP